MSAFPVYGLCTVVTAGLVVLLAMSTDVLVGYVNQIVTPCQHDSEYRNGDCICDNTNGVFGGVYCESCQCKHLGICSVVENSSSRWGCRCPTNQKWTGTLCDKCYASDHSEENCRGNCIELEGVFKHYGTKCDTLCMPDASSTDPRCIGIRGFGGTCNACNGHGSCTSNGGCDCDAGYFTSRTGEQCVLQCSDAGIECPVGQGECQSIGGQLQCVCETNWFGRDCDQSCISPGGNELPCSGHGTCGYDSGGALSCACSVHWTGAFCEQRCPGDASYPTSCSGHGSCLSGNTTAACQCVEGWSGNDCSCSEQYTCSGHGTCNEDASCECLDYTSGTTEVHFSGAYCERCVENWFGSNCQLFCDSSKTYEPNSDTNGNRIGCNGHGACQLETQLGNEFVTCICDGTDPDTFCAECRADYYPTWTISNVSVPHCSTTCEPGTCSNRGVCNPLYNGYNNLCICDTYTMPGTSIDLDTLDPLQNCATCKPNWYPTAMSSPDRCTSYCASDGKLSDEAIYFDISTTERNYDLMGDVEAQKVCTQVGSHFGPDADCNVCSSQGSCYADGTCKCDEGTTGEQCNIQCTSPDGLQCSDHGRCVRNELELWFNPNSRNFRCECVPFDPYTSETRQRLIKQNFRVAPPPNPDYYGEFCEFHCPRYNEEICSDRGECSTGIAVDDMGYTRGCNKDKDCSTIEGAFCARQSSPWDSLMQDGKSFFSSGPESPGYFTCAASTQCLEDIYSVKWDEFCVNMLHGWYPPVLNQASCTYAPDGTCRTAVEEFFMAEFRDGATWCEAALSELMPSVNDNEVCGKTSYADPIQFLNERVPVCLEYTLETTCNAQSDCIYDQTFAHIRAVDQECGQQSPPCSGSCQPTGNQTCETKTYCRAKTCPDAMFETSVESLCVLDPPCDSTGVDWPNFCAETSGKIRNLTSMSSMDAFYTCHMYRNRVNPAKIEKTIPGGIQMNGVLRIFGEDVSVESIRTSVTKTTLKNQVCALEDFTQNDFCANHLAVNAPEWYVPIIKRPNWFLPWLVACPQGPDSLWSTKAKASVRIEELQQECVAFHKSPGISGDEWLSATDEKDTISYSNSKKWSLDCPGKATKFFDDSDILLNGLVDGAESCLTENGWQDCDQTFEAVITSSYWPQNPSGCELHSNRLVQRWGEKGWSPIDVQNEFSKSCLQGLNAPWIPKATDVPTLCDLGACHFDDECMLCSDPEASCDVTASVQCTAPQRFNFRDDNRCARNGNAWQVATISSRTYFCDWIESQNVTVKSNGLEFQGDLHPRGILTIRGAASATLGAQATVIWLNEQRNETKPMVSLRKKGSDVTLVWSDDQQVSEAMAESFVNTIRNCNDNFNWYDYCAKEPVGKTLNTNGPFGLAGGWSGQTAYLQTKNHLVFDTITRETDIRNISISLIDSRDRVRLQCNTEIVEGISQVYLRGNFTKCTLICVYGTCNAESIRVNAIEEILDFDDANAQSEDRSFFVVDVSKNRSSYTDWTFNDGVISKSAFEYDNTGVRYYLDNNGAQQDSIRMSGWLYVPEDDGELAGMRLTNADGQTIIEVYVWSKSMYVKNHTLNEHHGIRLTSIEPNMWWFWSIEATHIGEKRIQAANHSVFAENHTYFAQDWQVGVSVTVDRSPVSWMGTREVESSVRLRHHRKKVAAAFDSFSASDSDTCGTACARHSDCSQWSFHAEDSLCLLYALGCHEDEHCRYGKHTLTSMGSHRANHFEIFSDQPKTSVAGGARWRHIRADPIIISPTCGPIPIENIHERWREPFSVLVVPFEPDATTICNALADSWKLMPEYKSKVCYGDYCDYQSNDIGACASQTEWQSPPTPDGCDENDWLSTNWTAYCHYVTSFAPIQTGLDNRIPFLGGASVNLTEICVEPWAQYDAATQACGSIDTDWFKQCLGRHSAYEEHCSSECLGDVETRLSSTNVSKGICEIRDEFLSVKPAPEPCDCPLGDLVITDFCLMQDAYHEGKTVLVPELYHSQCSELPGCSNSLRQSLNRSQWLGWCSDLSKGEIQGVCSKTTCDCDVGAIAGVAGKVCELSCPSGISDGQELACSGPNGRCFAVDEGEIIDDSTNQEVNGETRLGTNVSGPFIPNWLRGPSPSMDGRCQCSLGSGSACSIPCDRCNNGTYGYSMASQYGICDSFNGICRSFPPFMRYNTDVEQLKISYNTTAFESGLGIYRWQYPERFLFESDETLFRQALRYQSDPLGAIIGLQDSKITKEISDNINMFLPVFRDLCWPTTLPVGFSYLNNSESVSKMGIELTDAQPSLVLKSVQPPSWGQCTRIKITDTFHLCFAKGKMYAYDNGPLLVRSYGAENIPRDKISFVKRDSENIYAYGGEYTYERTVSQFKDLYKITYARRSWSPYDIVFVTWTLVTPSVDSVLPKASILAPMYSFYDRLILVESVNDEHSLFSLRYATLTRPAQWAKLTTWSDSRKIKQIHGNRTSDTLHVFFEDGTNSAYENGIIDRNSQPHLQLQEPPFQISPGFVAPFGTVVDCVISKSNESIIIGGQRIALYEEPAAEVEIYLEEWLTIDVAAAAGTIRRVHNAVKWRTINVQRVTQEHSQALDLVTRIHMHQGRWSLHRDMQIREKLSRRFASPGVRYIPMTESESGLGSFFSSLEPSLLEETPLSTPSFLSVELEGDTFERSLVISGLYGNIGEVYSQKIDFGRDEIVVNVRWNITEFGLELSRSNGAGRVQWHSESIARTFVLTIHLEEWLYNLDASFDSVSSVSGTSGMDAMLQLFLSGEKMSSHNMLKQTSSLLQYTPSHCSLTADSECPGLLPYVGLPCSGRGKCSIGCECTCEVAKSVLASSNYGIASRAGQIVHSEVRDVK